MMGADPGLLIWARHDARLEAALIVAPERTLFEALPLIIAPAAALAAVLAQAGDLIEVGDLGAVDFSVEWPDRVVSKGQICGKLGAAASTAEPTIVPDWLVVGIDVALWPMDGQASALWAAPPLGLGALSVLESWAAALETLVEQWQSRGTGPLIAAMDDLAEPGCEGSRAASLIQLLR